MDRFKVKNRLAPVMSEKGKRIFCGSLSFSFSYATTINENKKRFVLRFARFTLPLHNQTLSESEMKDSVLILSGGVDSTTLLYDEQARIALAISFDYGSKHNAREIPFARMHCERLGIKHITIPLDFMTKYFVSSLSIAYFARFVKSVFKISESCDLQQRVVHKKNHARSTGMGSMAVTFADSQKRGNRTV